jgi:hypothetical protein
VRGYGSRLSRRKQSSPLDQFDTFPIGAEAEDDACVELRHLQWRRIEQGHAGLPQVSYDRLHVDDPQGDVIDRARDARRAAVLDQLDPAVAGSQECDVLGSEIESRFEPESEHMHVEIDGALEIGDVDARVVERKPQADTSTSRTAIAFIS